MKLSFQLPLVGLGFAIGFSIICTATAEAQETAAYVEGCELPAPLGSTQLETEVWDELCRDGEVDMRDHGAGYCAGAEPDAEDLNSIALSDRFLTTVLTDSAYVAARTTPSIRLICSYIPVLDLFERRIPGSLRLENSTVGWVQLRDATVQGTVDFDQSHFSHGIFATGVRVERNFRMSRARIGTTEEPRDVHLSDARIDGNLVASGSVVTGEFSAFRIQVSGDFFLRDTDDQDAVFGAVDLMGARIAGLLSAVGATVVGAFRAEELSVGASALLRDSEGTERARGDASFGSVSLLGARIVSDLNFDGATVGGQLMLNGASIGSLFMRDRTGSAYSNGDASFGSVDVGLATIDQNLEAVGATVEGEFRAFTLTVGGYLLLQAASEDGNGDPTASFAEVILTEAQIGAALSMSGAVVTESLAASNIIVGGDLRLNDFTAEFHQDGETVPVDVELPRSQIDGRIIGRGITVSGALILDDVSVQDDLALFDEARLGSLSLRDGDIGANLMLWGTKIEGPLNINGLSVAGFVNATGSTVAGILRGEQLQVGGRVRFSEGGSFQDVDLTGSSIGGSLELHGSSFQGRLSLNGARLGSLRLFSGEVDNGSNPYWGERAQIILRNAFAETLETRMASAREWDRQRTSETGCVEAAQAGDDTSERLSLQDSWVRCDGVRLPIDLSGFVYNQLAVFHAGPNANTAQIDEDALIAWLQGARLEGMTGYRPQPYRAMENALREMGAEQAANEVAYARLIHRTDTRVSADFQTQFETWVGQVATKGFDRFLQFTVGFGVYPQRAFYWFLFFVLIGTILARPCSSLCKGGAAKATWGDSFFYSLENAIPLMEPSTDYAKVEHDTWAVRMFFNAQKVLGFVLATVLVGALTIGA